MDRQSSSLSADGQMKGYAGWRIGGRAGLTYARLHRWASRYVNRRMRASGQMDEWVGELVGAGDTDRQTDWRTGELMTEVAHGSMRVYDGCSGGPAIGLAGGRAGIGG